MLAFIGAMDEEVILIKDRMEQVEIKTVAGMDFYKGILKGQETVVVRCGIGKVNAAVCTQILADLYQVKAIVNTGIAGSLCNEINVGDIVLSTDAMYHDVDATHWGYPAGKIPRMDVEAFPADKKLMELAKKCCEEVNPDIRVFTGRVVSGDQFISEQAKKDWITDTFSAICTEMEGAAIGQAAYLNKIPFLIVRAISDKADENAKVDYKEFEEKAIRRSVNLSLAIASAF